MQTVAETPTFTRQCEVLFTAEEKADLIAFLAENPDAGVVLQGTGGLRKFRYAGSGRGKRGGTRVVTFFGGGDMPVYAIAVYAKSVKTDLSPTEKRTLARLADSLKAHYKSRGSG